MISNINWERQAQEKVSSTRPSCKTHPKVLLIPCPPQTHTGADPAIIEVGVRWVASKVHAKIEITLTKYWSHAIYHLVSRDCVTGKQYETHSRKWSTFWAEMLMHGWFWSPKTVRVSIDSLLLQLGIRGSTTFKPYPFLVCQVWKGGTRLLLK